MKIYVCLIWIRILGMCACDRACDADAPVGFCCFRDEFTSLRNPPREYRHQCGAAHKSHLGNDTPLEKMYNHNDHIPLDFNPFTVKTRHKNIKSRFGKREKI